MRANCMEKTLIETRFKKKQRETRKSLPTVVWRLRISFHKCLAAKRFAVISTDMPDKRDKSGGVILFGGLSRIMPFLPHSLALSPNWVELD